MKKILYIFLLSLIFNVNNKAINIPEALQSLKTTDVQELRTLITEIEMELNKIDHPVTQSTITPIPRVSQKLRKLVLLYQAAQKRLAELIETTV